MHVYIRPLIVKDAETSFKWRNDPEIWKFTEHKPDRVITHLIEDEWIRKAITDSQSKRFAICIKETQQYIGNLQITDISEHSAEYHIFIGEKKYWGQGFATEATALFLKYAAENLNLKYLKLWVHPMNIAAQKVYLNAGFKPLDNQINMIYYFREAK